MELETRLVAELRQTTLPEYVLSFALLWITSDPSAQSKVPTGPSAEQDATRNQKDFVNRLGASDQLPEGATK